MKKKVKVPLLKAKQAREMVESQKRMIHVLQEDLKSMTGARDNLQTMYKVHKKEAEDRKFQVQSLEGQMRSQEQNLAVIQRTLSEERRLLAAYKRETGVQMIGRGLVCMKNQVVDAVTNFVARLRFKTGL